MVKDIRSVLLGKKFRLINTEDNIIKTLQSLLKKELGEDIPLSSISHKNKIIYIKDNSVIRSEIFLKKGIIIEAFNNSYRGFKIKDIR